MSDLQPLGATIVFDGVERRLFWDFGVIEKIQEEYGGHPFYAIEAMYWDGEKDGHKYSFHQAKPVLDLLFWLLNNEVDRQKFFEGKSDLKKYTREQIGYLVDMQNVAEYARGIVESWKDCYSGGSMEDDEEPEDQKKKVK